MNFFNFNRPIRGYKIPLSAIEAMFKELAALTAQERDRFFATVTKPEWMPDDEYQKNLKLIYDTAFQVTVTIRGSEGELNFGNSPSVFSENVPQNVTSIYMTNVTAYKGAFGNDPIRRFDITISFEKPPALDWSPLVSAPTNNVSNCMIQSDDSSYARAIEGILNRTLFNRKTWYSFIHAPLVYDVFAWLFAFPYSAYQVSRALSGLKLPEEIREMRFLAAIYMVLLAMLFWRMLFSYAKWVFPLNSLRENEDQSKIHRYVVTAVFIGVVGNFAYDIIKLLSGLR